MKKVEVKEKPKPSDFIIPDYDHLFNEQKAAEKSKRKNGFFKKVLSVNKKSIFISSFLLIFQNLPIWITPLLTANIINIITLAITNGTGVTAQVVQTIVVNAIIILACILLNVPGTMLRWRVVSKMNRQTSAAIKSSVVRKLQHLSITYHNDMQSGRIQSKFLKDVESIDTLMHTIMFSLIPCIIGIIVSTGITIFSNEKGWIVSIFFVIVIPMNVLISKVFDKKLRAGYREYRLKNEAMGAKMNTMLEMMPVTKSHGLENAEINSFNKNIRDLTGAGLRIDKRLSVFGSAVWVVNELLKTTCVIFCVFLALNKIIGVGDIILYQTMFAQISSSIMSLTNIAPTIASGAESLDSISEVMNASDVEVSIGKKNIPSINGEVRFENVCYRYPKSEQDVVHNFNLDVKSGECIAVVGASGSGKSTLMNLIIGFMMPNSGNIFIDKTPIKDLNLSEYRHHISVVPQMSVLFPGSIRENITYGLDRFTEEDLNRVVEMANITEFLKELPNGLDTEVGEHGVKLSGGQRQRITIARALIRNPKILILDEATSALDNISEFHVQKAISSSIKGRTTFIVAHRLSTIRDADRIVVMEQGEMVECGTFSELMEKKGKFYALKELNDINLKKAEEALG